MKHKGCILEFTNQRNKELMKTFRKTLGEFSFIDIKKVSEVVVNSPCSRFWVSEDRAYIVISVMMKGQYALDSMHQYKREMFLEIFKRVQAMREENPEMPMDDIIFDVVNSPAPKFYMKPRYAMNIIYSIKKNSHSNHHHPHNVC